MIYQIQLFNKNYYENLAGGEVWSWSDSLALLAIFISIVSALLTYHTTYVGKKLDVRLSTFEKLIVQNVSDVLGPTDSFFLEDEFKDQKILDHLQKVTDVSSEIDLLLVSLKGMFNTLQIEHIIEKKEKFFDDIYLRSDEAFSAQKSAYRAFKISILHDLYKHAVEKEFSIWYQIKRSFFAVWRKISA